MRLLTSEINRKIKNYTESSTIMAGGGGDKNFEASQKQGAIFGGELFYLKYVCQYYGMTA